MMKWPNVCWFGLLLGMHVAHNRAGCQTRRTGVGTIQMTSCGLLTTACFRTVSQAKVDHYIAEIERLKSAKDKELHDGKH